MSAAARATECRSTTVSPLTGCVRLDVLPVGAEERAYCEARFGSGVEIDRAGNFYLVHRDGPPAELRAARLEDVRTSFRPSHCEHCAESVTRGGLYLFDSPGYAPRELKIVPVDRGGSRRSVES